MSAHTVAPSLTAHAWWRRWTIIAYRRAPGWRVSTGVCAASPPGDLPSRIHAGYTKQAQRSAYLYGLLSFSSDLVNGHTHRRGRQHLVSGHAAQSAALREASSTGRCASGRAFTPPSASISTRSHSYYHTSPSYPIHIMRRY